MRLLPPGTQLELAHSPQQTAEGLVSVVTAEGEAGWVQRGALRLRHDGIRRASHRRLATLDGSDGLGLADWSHPFFFLQMADPQRKRHTSPTARMRAHTRAYEATTQASLLISQTRARCDRSRHGRDV